MAMASIEYEISNDNYDIWKVPMLSKFPVPSGYPGSEGQWLSKCMHENMIVSLRNQFIEASNHYGKEISATATELIPM